MSGVRSPSTKTPVAGTASPVVVRRPGAAAAAVLVSLLAGHPLRAETTLFGEPWPEVGGWGQAWDDDRPAPPQAPAPAVQPLPAVRVPEMPAPAPVPRAPVAAASAGGRETLAEALAAAYTTNPRLLAQRAATRTIDEGVPLALSGYRPTVTLSGSAWVGRYENNLRTERDEGRSPSSYGLVVSQPLYRGGRTEASTRQAEAEVMVARAVLESIEQTVLLGAVNVTLDVLRSEAVADLYRKNIAVLEDELVAARTRFRYGEVTTTDVRQTEARLARTAADSRRADADVEKARASFANVVGHWPGEIVPVHGRADVAATFAEVAAAALSSHPNVVAADWQSRSAKEAIDVDAGDLLPTISAVGRYTRSLSASLAGSEAESGEMLLQFSVPLYQGGAAESRVRERKHTHGRRSIELEQARRDVQEAAAKAWNDYHTAHAALASYTAQVAAAELALAGVKEEANTGARIVLEILNAEQELLAARVNLERARYDEIAASFALKAAQGRMTAAALSLDVGLYDPLLHYGDIRDRWFGTDGAGDR